jgi:hypothetical protein
MIIESTYFPHKNINKDTWQSPDRRTNNQIDHVLVDGRHASSIMDVRSCRAADCDSDHHIVRIKCQQKISKYKNTHGARGSKYDVKILKDI